MAYYDALIAAWNTSSAGGGLPVGTTGASLQGLTTEQKLDAINAWVHTGSVPTTIYVTGDQVANCIHWPEFDALTAQKQANLLAVCGIPGLLKGGSANLNTLLVGMLINCFAAVPGGSVTLANLTAFAVAAQQPWWQFAGYPRTFDSGDIAAAGLS